MGEGRGWGAALVGAGQNDAPTALYVLGLESVLVVVSWPTVSAGGALRLSCPTPLTMRRFVRVRLPAITENRRPCPSASIVAPDPAPTRVRLLLFSFRKPAPPGGIKCPKRKRCSADSRRTDGDLCSAAASLKPCAELTKTQPGESGDGDCANGGGGDRIAEQTLPKSKKAYGS